MLPAIFILVLAFSVSGGFGRLISMCMEIEDRSATALMALGALTVVFISSEPVGNALLFVAHGGAGPVLA